MGLTEERRKEIQRDAEAGVAYAKEQGISISKRDLDRLDLLAAVAEAEREREEIRTLGAGGLQDALDEMFALRTRVRELEEENARLLEIQRGQQTTAEAYPEFTAYTVAQQVYLTYKQVQQVREVIEDHIFRMSKFRELLHDEDEIAPTFDNGIAQAKAALSLLSGGEEVR